MAALTKDRITTTKGPMRRQRYPVAASAKGFAGGLICLNASGFAAPAADTVNFSHVVGVATAAFDNTGGANGAIDVIVEYGGAFLFPHTGVTQANMGRDAYVSDDQTVVASGTNNSRRAGRFLELDGTNVWININAPIGDVVDASVGTADLEDNAVETAKIADLAVTDEKLAADAVTTAKIADDAVTADKIAAGAVTETKVANGTFQVRKRFTAAEVNAGATVVAAIAGQKIRMVDAIMIAIGGNAATADGVDITATQSAGSVKLIAAAVAALTQSAVARPGGSNVVVLADGASFVANDENTAVLIAKDGDDLATATHIDVIFTYAVDAA